MSEPSNKSAEKIKKEKPYTWFSFDDLGDMHRKVRGAKYTKKLIKLQTFHTNFMRRSVTMTFEMTRIKQRLADLENNQSHLLKVTTGLLQKVKTTQKLELILELEEIVKKNTGKDHP